MDIKVELIPRHKEHFLGTSPLSLSKSTSCVILSRFYEFTLLIMGNLFSNY